jgi:hypothetical protein
MGGGCRGICAVSGRRCGSIQFGSLDVEVRRLGNLVSARLDVCAGVVEGPRPRISGAKSAEGSRHSI